MVDVAVISKYEHIRKSLDDLLKSDPTISIIASKNSFNHDIKNLVSDKNLVVILDIETTNLEYLLEHYSEKCTFILYSHSKEYTDLLPLFKRYKIDFFNVYTNPETILLLIKRNFNVISIRD